jgi:hypothetical protein
MARRSIVLFLAATLIAATAVTAAASAAPTLLASGLEGGGGSTVGPDGALYVTEGAAGRVTRIDPDTGAKTTFATGLPPSIIGIGGAIDVVFVRDTAYVLVTLVGSDVGGSNPVGIYRVDGPNSFTVVADIGTFSVANPPDTDFFVPTGVQYALDRYRGGFLVTDGHHNRVLRVALDGGITEMMTFGNIVPTGLEVVDDTVYMAEAGPVPHLPQNGKIVTFSRTSPVATEVATGGRLLVDVEHGGSGRDLYGLAQGIFPDGASDGSPALPDTGSLLEANDNGTFTSIADGLDQPTSLELIHDTAYIVTLGGEIWTLNL